MNDRTEMTVRVNVKLAVTDETADACARLLGLYLDEHREKTLELRDVLKDDHMATHVYIVDKKEKTDE